MMERRGSQETARGGGRVSGTDLTELFLMGHLLGSLGLQQLLVLERELGVLRLEELLLLELGHIVRFVYLFLTSQLRSGDPLLFLLQGCCGDRGSA